MLFLSLVLINMYARCVWPVHTLLRKGKRDYLFSRLQLGFFNAPDAYAISRCESRGKWSEARLATGGSVMTSQAFKRSAKRVGRKR